MTTKKRNTAGYLKPSYKQPLSFTASNLTVRLVEEHRAQLQRSLGETVNRSQAIEDLVLQGLDATGRL